MQTLEQGRGTDSIVLGAAILFAVTVGSGLALACQRGILQIPGLNKKLLRRIERGEQLSPQLALRHGRLFIPSF